MKQVTSQEFQRNVGRYQDRALVKPVMVTKHGRAHVVVLSADEYLRLKRRAREALPIEALSDADVDAISKAEAPDHTARFDSEVAD